MRKLILVFLKLDQEKGDFGFTNHWIKLYFGQWFVIYTVTLSLFKSLKKYLNWEISCSHYIGFFKDFLSCHSQIINICAMLFWVVVRNIWYSLINSFNNNRIIYLMCMTIGFFPCFEEFSTFNIWCSLFAFKYYCCYTRLVSF